MLNEAPSSETNEQLNDLVGTFRTIGETGPLYEVLKAMSSDEVIIEVIHSGEVADYPADEAAKDPIAR